MIDQDHDERSKNRVQEQDRGADTRVHVVKGNEVEQGRERKADTRQR